MVKRGPMGCVVFDRAIPADIEDGIKGPGFPIEVFNVLGAGDAFMSGFLRGYLRDEPIEACCKYANACGALRGLAPRLRAGGAELGPSSSISSSTARSEHALRKDVKLEQVHWATTRTRDWPQVLAMAFDHRAQLEQMADEAGITHEHIAHFKQLCLKAARKAASGRPDFGILLDERLRPRRARRGERGPGGEAIWIGRPIELPGAVPLRFEGGPDVGCTLREWPTRHCVKCLIFYHPDDPEPLRAEQEARRFASSTPAAGPRHELLLEIIPSRSAAPGRATHARACDRALLCARHLARLVEAAGPGQPGRVGCDRGT